MLRVAVMLILGIIIGKNLFSFISYSLWLALAALTLVSAFVLRRHPIGQSVALHVVFLFIGACLMSHSVEKMNIVLPDDYVDYDAVLLTEPSVHGSVIQADMLIINGKGNRPMKVRASILRDTIDNRWTHLHVGDGIHAESLLEEPRNFAKSTFDYASWLREHGYVAETFIYFTSWQKKVIDLHSLSMADRTIIGARRMRQKVLDKYRVMGADGQTYAVLAAMTLGDKSALSRDLKDDYSISGASHVLALSGLHLGIIYAILSLLTLGRSRRWLSQLIIMVAIWTYVVIVGMSPSVMRSAIMLSIVALITILNRQRLSVNGLAVAAVVMLLINPLNLYDVGFEMSFMAVLGIVLINPLLMPHRMSGNKSSRHFLPLEYLKKIGYWVWGTIAVSISAQIGTAPLVAYYFGRFSCYFILTNLIVIPCATIILYGAVAVVLTAWWSAVSAFIADGVMACVDFMNSALHAIASLPGASIENISVSKIQILGLYIFFLFLYLLISMLSKDKRRR